MKKILAMLLLLSFNVNADFKVVEVQFYENLLGDRSAKVKVENISAFGRIINISDFTGITANNKRVKPLVNSLQSNHERVEGHKTTTFIIKFGRTTYPLESVAVD